MQGRRLRFDYSSILAWRTPWTEEPGRQATVHGVARVGHDLATKPPQAFTSLCRLLVIFKAKAVARKSSLT